MRPCRWIELDGTTILLDERRGDYLALGPDDSEIWRKLMASATADPADAAVRRLRLIAGKLGLLDAPSLPPASRTMAHNPSVFRAAWCILRATAILRLKGFLPACRWASASGAPPRSPAAALQPALATFLRAEHVFVSKLGFADCLPRSLALFAFLAGSGLPVRHVIGVRRYPFGAHAWVEHEGTKLLEAPDDDAPFAPIAMIPARR